MADIEAILNLRFFALLPNGKRIPVESLCEEYKQSPSGVFMKSFQDRLVVVVQAVKPDDTIYWNQAFYLSTGTSIGTNGFGNKRNVNVHTLIRGATWMPFHGIIGSAPIHPYFGKASRPLIDTTDTQRIITIWFAKDSLIPQLKNYGGRATESHFINSELLTDGERLKAVELLENYEGFLPEKRLHQVREDKLFSRMMFPSYLLASHALGGNAYSGNYEKELREYLNKTRSYPQSFFERILRHSPVQPCVDDAAKTTPLTILEELNAYIDRYGAIGRANAFRSLGLEVPGLAASSILLKNMEVRIPLEYYEDMLNYAVGRELIFYLLGKRSKEEVATELRKTLREMDVNSKRNSIATTIAKVTSIQHVLEPRELEEGGYESISAPVYKPLNIVEPHLAYALEPTYLAPPRRSNTSGTGQTAQQQRMNATLKKFKNLVPPVQGEKAQNGRVEYFSESNANFEKRVANYNAMRNKQFQNREREYNVEAPNFKNEMPYLIRHNPAEYLNYVGNTPQHRLDMERRILEAAIDSIFRGILDWHGKNIEYYKVFDMIQKVGEWAQKGETKERQPVYDGFINKLLKGLGIQTMSELADTLAEKIAEKEYNDLLGELAYDKPPYDRFINSAIPRHLDGTQRLLTAVKTEEGKAALQKAYEKLSVMAAEKVKALQAGGKRTRRNKRRVSKKTRRLH
jgi:hypothetical protein